ncbi:MAG: hypothetical protein GXY73_11735 [Methanothrix sp.]|nr:hypothetical protein [Methanothrix sp.]
MGSQASQDRGGRLFDRLGGRRLLTIFLDLVGRAPPAPAAALASQRAPSTGTPPLGAPGLLSGIGSPGLPKRP